MAKDTLAERDTTFNRSPKSSLHSHAQSRAKTQFSGDVEKLEYVIMLLAQADALSTVALRDAFDESCSSERHHYLSALHELISTAHEQLEDLL